jgi:hypothetical protein
MAAGVAYRWAVALARRWPLALADHWAGSACNVPNTAFVTVCPVFVGNEVVTAVGMKSTAPWDIMQCSPLKVNWRFEGTYHLH